jgi:hypothetical protein
MALSQLGKAIAITNKAMRRSDPRSSRSARNSTPHFQCEFHGQAKTARIANRPPIKGAEEASRRCFAMKAAEW